MCLFVFFFLVISIQDREHFVQVAHKALHIAQPGEQRKRDAHRSRFDAQESESWRNRDSDQRGLLFSANN